MPGELQIVIAATTFVGTHFLMSHPLRAPLVARLGEGGFAGVYSLVSFLTLGWTGWAFWVTPATPPLWPVGDALWAGATAVMLLASILLVGSLVRNPALPTGGAAAAIPAEARGVFAITRHPMMWSVALWGACHVVVYPVAKNIIVSTAMIVLALVGAALQDNKKEHLQTDTWSAWEAKTSYWPFAAVISRRARVSGFGMHAFAGGVVIWLAATWAHIPLSGWTAGLWRWIRT